MANEPKPPESFVSLMTKSMSKESVGPQCVQIKWWLSTGIPMLDHALRPGHPVGKQGIPNGKWLELLGPESAGKTALGCRIGASCQQIGGHFIYLAGEAGTFDEFLQKCGVNMDPEYFTSGHPFSLESCVQAIENIVYEYHDKGRPIVIMVDSISGLESADYTMDGQAFKKSTPQAAGAKVLHRFLRRGQSWYLQGAPIWGIVIRHETGSPRAFDFGTHTTHGKALDYHTWVRLKCTSKAFEDKYGGKEAGRYLNATVIKSKIGPSYGQVSVPFFSSFGWDIATEQLQYLIEDAKVLPPAKTKAGEDSASRYVFRGIGMLRREIRDLYYNDPTARQEIDTLVQLVLANGGNLPL